MPGMESIVGLRKDGTVKIRSEAEIKAAIVRGEVRHTSLGEPSRILLAQVEDLAHIMESLVRIAREEHKLNVSVVVFSYKGKLNSKIHVELG